MRNNGKRTAAWALTMACWGVMGSALVSGTGCEKMEGAERQADRTVEGHLGKSRIDRENGGDAGSAAALEDLKKAASTAGASAAVKARASSELAQEEFDRAVAQLPAINRRTLRIEQALWNLHQAGRQIERTQQTVAAFNQLDPNAALNFDRDALLKLYPDPATAEKLCPEFIFKLDPKSSFAELLGKWQGEIEAKSKKARDDSAAVQAKLDEGQNEINALKEERKKADADAESLAQKSAAAKGEESQKLFEQVTAARIKAGEIAARMEEKTGALFPLQRDLARAQQVQLFWDNAGKDTPGAMQELAEHKQQVEAGWQKVQAQVQASGESAKTILATTIKPAKENGGANDGERLRKLVEENEAQCAAVAKLLSDSGKHFGEAAAAARKLSTDLQTKIRDTKDTTAPELAAWKGLMALYDENQYLLQQGTAQNALGDLHAGQAIEHKHRKETLDDLAKALAGSQLQLPADLPTADPAKASDEAVSEYKNAEKTLDPVAEATKASDDLPVLKGAARIGLLHAHLGRYALTHGDDSKNAFNIDQLKATEANLELPALLKQKMK